MESGLNSIGDDVYVYLGNYQEEVRIKIKKLTDGADGRKEQDGNKGISLTMEQWEALCKVRQEVTEQVEVVRDRDVETKRAWRLSPNRFVTVDRIKSNYINAFVTLINIRIYFMGGTDLPENPTRYGITLKPVQWLNLLSNIDNINGKLKPDEDGRRNQILLEVVADTMLDCVDDIAKEHCHGCKVNHPSQIQHMSNGCLSEQEEKISSHFQEARQKLRLVDTKVSMFRKALTPTEESEEHKIWGELNNKLLKCSDEEIKAMMMNASRDWNFIIRV